MQKLIKGIHQFQRESFVPLQGLFEQLAKGQSPDTLFITCSDSRIDPTLLTRTPPGDLFILRNAGNIVPPHGAGGGEAATIEFAVAGLGVKDIIICGHSHCGAMKGILDPDQLVEMPAVAAWLSNADSTRRIMKENYSELEGDRLLSATVEENVLVQLENLRTLPSVAARLAKGDLHLHGWVYKIETGQVFAYDVVSSQFLKLTDCDPPVEPAVQHRKTNLI
ncbi:Carbonic anhydrase [Rosistilla oblonga]|uniref:carbonic anhydrase n=1 Tax=Rosistilla oblonga TaxID=2527990 RepID=UPI00118A8EAD|nr:carbonic anhydrase [Rosistilla oblonga]QDV14479.1 Carbonic anhydrase [Rosistilla oblonga]